MTRIELEEELRKHGIIRRRYPSNLAFEMMLDAVSNVINKQLDKIEDRLGEYEGVYIDLVEEYGIN